MRLLKRFISENKAVIAIELALALPVLLLILFGIIEFGIAFMKAQVAQRQLALAAQSLMADPANPDLRTLVNHSGSALVDYAQPENFVCARAFSSYEAAQQQASSCRRGEWRTYAPQDSGSTYYVAVRSQVDASSLTRLFSAFLGKINETQVVPIRTLSAVIKQAPTHSAPAIPAIPADALPDIRTQRQQEQLEAEMDKALQETFKAFESMKKQMER